ADRPGPGVGEDVGPRPLDLVPAVQAVPAGVDAADGGVVVPDRGHGFEVPGLQRPVEREVRGGHRCRFGRHAPNIYRRMADDTGIGEGSGKFPATRASAVLAAQSPNLVERERGLAVLLETYWRPVYKYLRLRYRESNEDAKDLTQAFFARALEKEFF